jgi:hypothetical protein
MVQWVLIFIIGMCAGFLAHRPTPPPECPSLPEQMVCPEPPKCEANKNVVEAAEMIQKEFNLCYTERGNLTDQLESCRRDEDNLQTQVNDWRDRYYQQ